jgi:methionine-rich copper-binding protein CopC
MFLMCVTFRNSLCLAIVLLLITASLTTAHAELIQSAPMANEKLEASPQQITLWFDEELDSQHSLFQVFDGAGRKVSAADGRVDLNDVEHASLIGGVGALPDGVYTVRWQAVTPDDDGMTEGQFDFIVGDAARVSKGASLPNSTGVFPIVLAGIAMVIAVAGVMVRRSRT